MNRTKIAINGFGRIGRAFFKLALTKPELEIVAINDLGELDNLAYLLKYDSAYGRYDKEIKVEDEDGKKYLIVGPTSPEASNGQGKIIGVKLPIKMELKVTEAHEATKGNTAQGATKSVKLETGAEIQVPMFIKEGEIVKVNTETGEYAERVGGSNF